MGYVAEFHGHSEGLSFRLVLLQLRCGHSLDVIAPLFCQLGLFFVVPIILENVSCYHAKFFKRHEELINSERLKENDAIRKKDEEKRRREDHARQNQEHDKALAEMVERGNPNHHRTDLPPMLGSQDVAMMAQTAAAIASPPQAPQGPSPLQNATKEAAAKIKIVMEKRAKAPKDLGLGNLMPL